MYTIYYRYNNIDKLILTPWAPATKTSSFALPCGYFATKSEAAEHLFNTIVDWPLVKQGGSGHWYVAIAHQENPVFFTNWIYRVSDLVKSFAPNSFEVLT